MSSKENIQMKPHPDPKNSTPRPEEPYTLPEEPYTLPEEPYTLPEEPYTLPEEPTSIPEEPTSIPEEPTSIPEEPTSRPDPREDAQGSSALEYAIREVVEDTFEFITITKWDGCADPSCRCNTQCYFCPTGSQPLYKIERYYGSRTRGFTSRPRLTDVISELCVQCLDNVLLTKYCNVKIRDERVNIVKKV